jgi:transaldolase
METAMKSIKKLHKLGQSIWYDNIERKLLKNGDLSEMIELGYIRGVTSNPSIFNNAIAKSTDYDDALIPLAKEGKTQEEIYEALAIADIQAACDLFRPLYDETEGGDGYVSLEVSPYLANDTERTLKDAKRLWKLVDRPNLMIKIPATQEGLSAITEAIANGININITLIFSIQRYLAVMDAFQTGLEKRLEAGNPIDHVASVASFFVSRIDSNVDQRLIDGVNEGKILDIYASDLLGKVAVANAKLAYQTHKNFFSDPCWKRLEESGANIQRPLWASTSTKNPKYPDTKYLDELIGPNTINTVPPKTLEAFADHGTAELTLESDITAADEVIDDLENLGISIDEVTQELEIHGVKSFADAFTALLDSIEKSRVAALA